MQKREAKGGRAALVPYLPWPRKNGWGTLSSVATTEPGPNRRPSIRRQGRLRFQLATRWAERPAFPGHLSLVIVFEQGALGTVYRCRPLQTGILDAKLKAERVE